MSKFLESILTFSCYSDTTIDTFKEMPYELIYTFNNTILKLISPRYSGRGISVYSDIIYGIIL